MVTSTSDGRSSESFLAEPHQPRSFNFPRREFGKKRVIKRSFNPSWFDRYKWLHYVCRCAAHQTRLIMSLKDTAFTYKGFRYWKDGTVCLSLKRAGECVFFTVIFPRWARLFCIGCFAAFMTGLFYSSFLRPCMATQWSTVGRLFLMHVNLDF